MHEFFARLDEKDNLLEILRKLAKILKDFFKKIANCIILAYFSKKFNETIRYLFARVDEKDMIFEI